MSSRFVMLAGLALIAASCDQPDTRNGEMSSKSVICGDGEIRGNVLEPIEGSGACGIEEPVRVSWVAGVELEPAAVLNCTAARALKSYVSHQAIPLLEETGGGLDKLEVAASYACRGRNGIRGARMSEHALGNAIDISGFVMASGETLTVEDDWDMKLVNSLHHNACGIYGTTLGPGSDGYHEDHFHFDVADHRNGPYCH